ncbi:hypothetical protein RHODO2019_17620 [Rhodococcus antarcticus]|uniref:Uncharacterized protein n=1 Tax=Rhodococcus antarcticus TaxID=2987751 RepID=A0ABY6P0L1_9NOCA|nr:hypothetical protein [Rhodococcus antarcticus]UZJ24891.1 hypothetical protein RHODO2019_17620 [Rhodococcus antarcticus]
MNANEAHQLLADLREETARLRDPAALQFVGGDPAADAASLDATVAQRAGVPALRLQAPALATATNRPVVDVLAEIGAYDEALAAAVEQLRSGHAPVTARRSQPAPRDSEAEHSHGHGHGHGHDEGHGHGHGLAGEGLTAPSWRRGAVVAVVVLLLVVLAFVLLL